MVFQDQIKVLLIDDDPDYVRAMAMKFQAAGDFSLVTARDGVSGLKRARAFEPDVIVADLQMPGMDGWEFSKRLRQDSLTQDIPLVIVTGYICEELTQEASALGAARVLLKFFEDDGLLDAARRAAASRRHEIKPLT